MDVILEFRAGRMALEANQLRADTRKGLVQVGQDDSGLVHFCWVQRGDGGEASGEPEVDICLPLPGEATFELIPGRRVFLLKFPEERSRDLFFWAQEPAGEDDEGLVGAVNALLSGEAMIEAMEADAPPAVTLAGMAGAAPSAAAPSAAATGGAATVGASGSAPINAGLLAAALGNIMGGAAAGASGGEGVAAAGLAALRAQLASQPSLSEVLRPELVGPLLEESPALAERLAPHLPEAYRSPGAIRQLLSTPQFRHQVALLNHALATGELSGQQFGLPQGGPGVLEFLRALQRQAEQDGGKQQQQQGGGGGDGQRQQGGGSS